MKRAAAFRFLLVVFTTATMLFTSGVTLAEEQGMCDEKAGEEVTPTPRSEKVSSRLEAMIGEMKARGITRENARQLGASALSTSLVRVNEQGSIQTYIHVVTFGDEEKALLEAHNVAIEITNEELGIIQAWIPFDKIYEIAELPFVKRITPPGYATPRVSIRTTIR